MLSKPFWYRLIHFNISAGSQRIKYYLAWVLADAVNNASGLGFNGYDEKGNAKWDLVSNVNIFREEVIFILLKTKHLLLNWPLNYLKNQ